MKMTKADRLLAFVLAMVMCLSIVDGPLMTAVYAEELTEGQTATLSEGVEEAAEEGVESEEPEEIGKERALIALTAVPAAATFYKDFRSESSFALNQDIKPVTLKFDAEGSVLADDLKADLWAAAIAEAPAAFESDLISVTCDSLAAGTANVTFAFAGDSETKECSAAVEMELLDARALTSLAAKEVENNELNLIFNEDMTANVSEMMRAVWDTFVNAEGVDYSEADIKLSKIQVGACTATVSYSGNQEKQPAKLELNLVLVDGRKVLAVNESIAPVLMVRRENNEDAYAALAERIVNAYFANLADEDLSASDFEVTYKYTNSNAGRFIPLSGSTANNWFAIDHTLTDGAVTRTIKITYPGNQYYQGVEAVFTLELTPVQKENCEILLTEDTVTVVLPHNNDQLNTINVPELEKMLFKALYVGGTPELTEEDLTEGRITFRISVPGGIFVPLEWSTNLMEYASNSVKLIYSGNDTYKGNEAVASVKFTQYKVNYNEDVAITYNADAAVMKQDLMAVIAEDSVLPDTVEFEYRVSVSTLDSLGILSNILKLLPGGKDFADSILHAGFIWAPIEGYGENKLAPMNAGIHQIRVRGSSLFNSDPGVSVKVNKADAMISIKSTSVYVDQDVPADMITVSPANSGLDCFTVYTGATSDIRLAVYVDLPGDILNNKLLISRIDAVLAENGMVTITDMMNSGISLRDLRSLVRLQDALDLLALFGVDTDAISQVVAVLEKVPLIGENTIVGLGTPKRAGLYNVTAITGNNNYNLAIGTGTLRVKMRVDGVKLNWNQEISGSIKASEVKNQDWGVTVTYNGTPVQNIYQNNVRLIYTGLTGSFRLYTSSTAPTEPGSYAVIASTIGGNYYGSPITRSFRIVTG